jgi:signal transduction histidine kinase
VSNALKYTERARSCDGAAPRAGGRRRFAVADTGIGIAKEHQELIFEEFGQVKGRCKRRVRGTASACRCARASRAFWRHASP